MTQLVSKCQGDPVLRRARSPPNRYSPPNTYGSPNIYGPPNIEPSKRKARDDVAHRGARTDTEGKYARWDRTGPFVLDREFTSSVNK